MNTATNNSFVSRLVVMGGLILLMFRGALAQPIDTLITETEVLAGFEDPVALAVDQEGQIYVVDRQRAVISQLSPTGKVLAEYGGPGSSDYEFDAPADIDVGGGLIWLVADAGNGRIKRYSSEFLHLASTPLDISSFAVRQSAGRGGFREEEGDPLRYAQGRPIAVASTISDETFALDADRGVIVKWDDSRRIERTFGSGETSSRQLVDPISVDTDRRGRVYVGDRGVPAVFVFDRFGTFIRTISEGTADDLQWVTVTNERVFVVLPEKLKMYDLEGTLLRTYGLDIGEPLRRVAVADGTLLLLTDTHLRRVRL